MKLFFSLVKSMPRFHFFLLSEKVSPNIDSIHSQNVQSLDVVVLCHICDENNLLHIIQKG